MSKLDWNKNRWNKYNSDLFECRSALEREADRILRSGPSYINRGQSQQHQARPSKRAKQPRQTQVIDSGLRFVTIKHPNGDLQTIGRDCPWFAETLAAARA